VNDAHRSSTRCTIPIQNIETFCKKNTTTISDASQETRRTHIVVQVKRTLVGQQRTCMCIGISIDLYIYMCVCVCAWIVDETISSSVSHAEMCPVIVNVSERRHCRVISQYRLTGKGRVHIMTSIYLFVNISRWVN
jgi:hypothetical protein